MTKYMRIQSVPIKYEIAEHHEGTGAGVATGMGGAQVSVGHNS